MEFRYRPNELEIVSVETVREYPLLQETIWLMFAVGSGSRRGWRRGCAGSGGAWNRAREPPSARVAHIPWRDSRPRGR